MAGGSRAEDNLFHFTDHDSFFSDSGGHQVINEAGPEDNHGDDQRNDEERINPPGGTNRKQWTTLLIFSVANVFVGVVYSVTFPYFPITALHKHNISNRTMGLILGIYELALVVASAFFGKFIFWCHFYVCILIQWLSEYDTFQIAIWGMLGHIGARFVFITSMLVLGVTSILFGFVDDIQSKDAYISLCLLIRTLAGIAGSGINTSSLAITATLFPETVTKMLGVLELCSGLGIMLGPVIGGAFYSTASHSLPKEAFLLPLAVCGVLLILIGVASIRLLPDPSGRNDTESIGSLRIAFIPSVIVIGLLIIMGGAAISYINATLADELKIVYKLGPIPRSLVFVVGPFMYALTAPFWGHIADKYPSAATYVLTSGYLLAGLSLWIMGPVPFTNIKHFLWLIIFSQVPLGLGIGTVVVTFKLITMAAIERGHPEGFGTTAVVSGLFGSYFSIGAFIGPWLGGTLKDDHGFAWASFDFGCAVMSSAVLLFFFTFIKNVCNERATEAERRRLIINYQE